MNKEQAIDTLKQRKNELTYKKLEWMQIYKEREDTPSAKMKLKEIADEEQALDIAIESLDNEWQTDTPKESGYYLVTNGANKVDIRKYDNGWYHDMYRRYTNEELQVVAWKKIEPYERKE